MPGKDKSTGGPPKRKIDRLRESAGSMDLNFPDDSSEITGMLTLGESLLIVKHKGIYEVKMADQIDPKRTNVEVPNTVQRFAPFGSDEALVGKILLTAHGLLEKDHLASHVDSKEAMYRIAQITKNVAEMQVLADRFAEEQNQAIEKFEGKVRANRSLVLPSMNNVNIRVNEFFQKADHAFQNLFDVVKLFYRDISKGGWNALKTRIDSEAKVDNFGEFLDQVMPLLASVRSGRNAIEHERRDMKLIVDDFSIDTENQLVLPTVELVHPKSAFQKVAIKEFMEFVQGNTVDIVELMIVFVCARNVDSGSLNVSVIEIPQQRRLNPNVRYGYGVNVGGQLVPLS